MIARNVLANLISMAVSIAVQAGLAFGGYRLAGAEQYGLIGFFSTLLIAAAIFDAGLGQTVTRAVARDQVEAPGSAGRLVFNFTLIYGGLAALVILLVWLCSPLLAEYWLKPRDISTDSVQQSLVLMGFAIGIQRLRGAFQAVLEGLERQVVSGLLLSATGLLRLALGLGALAFVAPTAEAFLWSQILASLLETGAFALGTACVVPGAFMPQRLEAGLIWQTLRFAGANMAAAATGTLVQIADSLVVSAMLPLSVFGTYSLVSTMCSAMVRLTTPLITAVFPRMSGYVRAERAAELRSLFFAASQATFVLMLAAAGALVFFGATFIELVSGRPEAGDEFAPVLAALAIAYALSGLCRPSHALQMAEGNPVAALRINIVTGAIYLPAILWLTPRYGVILPALCLIGANLLAFILFTATAFRSRLKGAALPWLSSSVLPQLAAMVASYGLMRVIVAGPLSLSGRIGLALAASVLALGLGVLCSNHLRPHLERLRQQA
ncbi:lipopolysaccharide biosynthesis protein [Pseudoroseomonas globiformis]|uniref:Lipopolysaccharide biosynthesis protein n=1 Tax=Teichococcus globiformis TaxID=2307229 RepID=A0ABV7G4Q4_9PROT